MDGSITKLRIVSLPGPDSSGKGGLGGLGSLDASTIASTLTTKIFEVQINPESISRSFSIKYNEPDTKGTPGTELQFDKVNPEELELRFIMDGTGVVAQSTMPSADLIGSVMNALPADAQGAYVPVRVAQLQAAVYDFKDESHRTPFLLVQYGKLVFMGLLLDMSINYNLFSPDGIPLRAEITLKLKAHTPFKDSMALLSLLSPDLSRHHMVVAGENILRICDDVYDDEKYYLEVAKANKLTNFRNLQPGTQLILPPIDKTSKK
jgi:Contractile injection system tube protein